MDEDRQTGHLNEPAHAGMAGDARAMRDLDDRLYGSLEQTEELIELIRSTAGFSLDKHEGVEAAVTQVGEILGEVLTQFCGIKLEAETEAMAMLEHQLAIGEEAPPLDCARVEMAEEQPVLFFVAAPHDFREVLNTALGVTPPPAEQPIQTLSFAEQKLFLRFVDRLTNAIYAAFHHLNDGQVPKRPADCPVEDVVEFGKGGEAVLIDYKVAHGDGHLTFRLVFPLWILEPDFAPAGEAGAVVSSPEPEADAASLATGWDTKMQEIVSGLNIPLMAELAVREVPLAEVDNLQLGPLPGFEFAMDGLRILDAQSKPVMIANLRVRDGALELQVVKEAGRNAV